MGLSMRAFIWTNPISSTYVLEISHIHLFPLSFLDFNFKQASVKCRCRGHFLGICFSFCPCLIFLELKATSWMFHRLDISFLGKQTSINKAMAWPSGIHHKIAPTYCEDSYFMNKVETSVHERMDIKCFFLLFVSFFFFF